jgi:hypothetical protein
MSDPDPTIDFDDSSSFSSTYIPPHSSGISSVNDSSSASQPSQTPFLSRSHQNSTNSSSSLNSIPVYIRFLPFLFCALTFFFSIVYASNTHLSLAEFPSKQHQVQYYLGLFDFSFHVDQIEISSSVSMQTLIDCKTIPPTKSDPVGFPFVFLNVTCKEWLVGRVFTILTSIVFGFLMVFAIGTDILCLSALKPSKRFVQAIYSLITLLGFILSLIAFGSVTDFSIAQINKEMMAKIQDDYHFKPSYGVALGVCMWLAALAAVGARMKIWKKV